MNEYFLKIGYKFRNRKKVNVWQFLNIAESKTMNESLKKLKKMGIIKVENNDIKLTKKGTKFFQKILKFKIDKRFKEKYKKLRKSFVLKDEYDQHQLTFNTVIRKLRFMIENVDIFDKNIICLGDDDLFGIALALTELPTSVTILDIDKRILSYEKNISKKLKTRIEVSQHDLTEPIPKRFRSKFDVFITEPPYTIRGLTLFVSRAVECLKENGVGYLGIAKSDIDPEMRILQQFEKNLLEMGFVITDILTNLQLYKLAGDELEWEDMNYPEWIKKPKRPFYKADLIRVKAVGKPKPLIRGKYSKDITKYSISKQLAWLKDF
jgi:hypothetical protein